MTLAWVQPLDDQSVYEIRLTAHFGETGQTRVLVRGPQTGSQLTQPKGGFCPLEWRNNRQKNSVRTCTRGLEYVLEYTVYLLVLAPKDTNHPWWFALRQTITFLIN